MTLYGQSITRIGLCTLKVAKEQGQSVNQQLPMEQWTRCSTVV